MQSSVLGTAEASCKNNTCSQTPADNILVQAMQDEMHTGDSKERVYLVRVILEGFRGKVAFEGLGKLLTDETVVKRLFKHRGM